MASTSTTGHDGSTVRHLRIRDTLWVKACQRAAADGVAISHVVRTLLQRYADGKIDL